LLNALQITCLGTPIALPRGMDELESGCLEAKSEIGVTAFVLQRVRRLIVTLVGGTVLLVGLALVFLPGPAVVVVPIGLGILAAEFAWARRLLIRLRASMGLAPPSSEADEEPQP
jgi:tellurite resistance protein TerC